MMTKSIILERLHKNKFSLIAESGKNNDVEKQ